jgi:broad specificity phosphatase PhoE
MNGASEGATQAKSRIRARLSEINPLGRQRRTAMWRFVGIAVATVALLVGAAVPASAAESMRVTFVRHGESAGNASGLIDTTTPGPVLTPLGQQQARDVVGLLGDNNYDAIYGSTMVRTQLTAAPMSQYLGLPINVLPGLQEIPAGVFEGTPEADAQGGYGLYPIGWTFPGVIPQIPVETFNKDTFMPGTDENGYSFDARVDGALQTMYDNGDRNAVVFSHGGTIMFWTMMNVNNLSAMEKLQLLQTAQLDNTDYVVIEGNNEDGWTLVDWNGQRFSPEPTLRAEIALQTRTLKRQLAATANQVVQSFATRDITKILTAINRGAADAQYSVSKFRRAVNAKIINEIGKIFSPPAPSGETEDTPSTHSEVASVMAATDTVETSDTAARSASASTLASDNAKSSDSAAKSEAVETQESIQPSDAVTEPEPTTSEQGAAEEVSAEDGQMSDGDKTVPTVRTTRPARAGNRGQLTADDVKDGKDYVSRFTRKDATDEKDDTNSGTVSTSDAGGSSSNDSAGGGAGESNSAGGGSSDSDNDSEGRQRDAA